MVFHKQIGWGGDDAGVLLRPLALAIPFGALLALATPILWVSGRATRELWVNLSFAVPLTFAAYVAAMISVELVAWTVGALLVLRSGLILAFAVQVVKVERTKLLRVAMVHLACHSPCSS